MIVVDCMICMKGVLSFVFCECVLIAIPVHTAEYNIIRYCMYVIGYYYDINDTLVRVSRC